jgi:subtilase family serine protease
MRRSPEVTVWQETPGSSLPRKTGNPYCIKQGEIMMRKFSACLLTTIALVGLLSVVSYAESRALLTRHTRDVVVNGVAPSVGRLPANQSMRIVLVLPLRNQAGLEAFLQDIYDPSSRNYRNFVTVDEFTARYGPSEEDYATVKQFAEAHGFQVVKTSRNRMNLDVVGSVASIEKAFHVTMGVYQHPTENRTFFAPDREPTVDMAVQLWAISGLDNYSIPHPLYVRRDQSSSQVHSNATTGSCPSKSFCGSDMRAAYYEGTTLNGSGQSLGLLEYGGTDLADLTTYYTNAHQTNNVPITLDSVDGTPTTCFANQGCDDTEQTIDMTQALGMAPNMSSLVMYIGSPSTVDDVGIYNAMATASPLNAQLSSSWSWTPADPTKDDPYFLEFQAQGQNMFQATGDSGKWPQTFVWPADDPNLVAVGGTDLTTTGAGGGWASETAWSGSGGGISPNHFAIPSWQVATANQCIDPCSKVYRNAPDVAANANYTFYVCADQTACTANLYGGTSFATPMWAGYLALANQQAVSQGEKTLGFINPLIYPIGLGPNYDTDFHDITSGSNGYSATVGYDLVTGWGSPNGANLINALVPPATSGFSISANPSTITVKKGTTGTTTITSTITGSFNAKVGLKGPAPAFKFSPNPIPAPGSGNSTMSIAVPSTAPTGTHKVTITGSGGGLTETTTVTINITN